MEKSLLLCAMMAPAIYCSANGFPPMTFELTNGNLVKLDSKNLSMSFVGDNLLASHSGGVFETPVAQVSKFYFDLSSTSVESVITSDDESVAVYDAAGIFRGNFANSAAAKSSLPAGLYIFKNGSKTLKTIVK